MSFVEIIAFGVSILSLLYLFFSNLGEAKLAKMAEEWEKKAVPQPPVPHHPHIFKAKKKADKEDLRIAGDLERKLTRDSLEKKRSANAAMIISREHALEIPEAPSKGRNALNRLVSLKDLVIYKEILDKPKGLE
ncbi:MAG: hypothetical protein H0V82_01060 [Candidatus Protochlamydia sp.]|nr:hypothetical protein [Candidatus Protochlamydia sp.]